MRLSGDGMAGGMCRGLTEPEVKKQNPFLPSGAAMVVVDIKYSGIAVRKEKRNNVKKRHWMLRLILLIFFWWNGSQREGDSGTSQRWWCGWLVEAEILQPSTQNFNKRSGAI